MKKHNSNGKKSTNNEGGGGGGGEDTKTGKEKESTQKTEGDEINATIISDEIDCFLGIILSLKHDQTPSPSPPQLPTSSINKFLSLLEKDLSDDKQSFSPATMLDSVDRLSRLSTALSAFPSEPTYIHAKTRASAVLQLAMSFLDDSFRILLEGGPKSNAAASDEEEKSSCSSSSSSSTWQRAYPPETVEKLRAIADTMITLGYESECYQTFSLSRRNAFELVLSDPSFRRMSIDEVQKLQWETLEKEIAKWVEVFRAVTTSLASEHELCHSVFSQHASIAGSLLSNLGRDCTIHLLNFVETIVTIIPRTAEKLFKVLDMYEALRDMLFEIDAKFLGEEKNDAKSAISAAKSCLGEAAGMMFCDLENSIKADVAKTPLPGGAVHPLTRYVMNYLKYACDQYKKSLEQVFTEMPKEKEKEKIPLGPRVIDAMVMLDANLEAKSKLYKDSALSYIFLMNNGRYIVKKIKESGEMYSLVGDPWYRKRSGDLRQYHKNYQRETWNKVLVCLKDDGLQVKGGVSKQAVKEKMKSFNVILEELLKRQCTWVVSDEQLKSELRVSISAVLVPAYRSFLGRYRQCLEAKHIKFGPEDLEARIDELFDGSTYSTHGRKR